MRPQSSDAQPSSSSSTATDASSSGYCSDDSDSSADTRRHRDGTQCTATVDELAIARQLAKDPWGRFGGKEGKMARIRRQEAALAAQATGSKNDVVQQPVPVPPPSKRASKKARTPLVVVIGDEQPMDVDQRVPQRVVDGQWWGARYFAWGGLLGSSLRKTSTRQRGFSEQDQEALYTRTQDGKVKGKQGLGRAGRPGHVRGVAWKGSKVVFDTHEEGCSLKGVTWKAHVKKVLRQVWIGTRCLPTPPDTDEEAAYAHCQACSGGDHLAAGGRGAARPGRGDGAVDHGAQAQAQQKLCVHG